jgi:hydrogenase-4 component B
MKKTAVYGILRFCVDLLGIPDTWWGLTVLSFGTLSVLFGAFYALTERDLKRLLAYSSVENLGIILIGVGIGMLGITLQAPLLAVLGFLAALYHMLNHAFFKGLLFLNANSIIVQAGTSNLNQMGGLNRRMPWTAITFLIAALAAVAIPPLNGFVSEWFTYQALLKAAGSELFALRVFAPLFAVLLALAGGLAVMVYLKAYGGAFTGPSHHKNAGAVKEASLSTRLGATYLALGVIILGLGAPWIAPVIAAIAANIARQPLIDVSLGWAVQPGDSFASTLSTPLLAILLLGLLVLPLLVVALYGGWRASRRSDVEPWACGYGYDPGMSVRASSFDQPVRVTFQPLYWIRRVVDRPYRALDNFYHSSVAAFQRAEPVVENTVTRPTVRFVETAGHWIQTLQMGDIRLYCLYIIITLAILLIVIFGGSGL